MDDAAGAVEGKARAVADAAEGFFDGDDGGDIQRAGEDGRVGRAAAAGGDEGRDAGGVEAGGDGGRNVVGDNDAGLAALFGRLDGVDAEQIAEDAFADVADVHQAFAEVFVINLGHFGAEFGEDFFAGLFDATEVGFDGGGDALVQFGVVEDILMAGEDVGVVVAEGFFDAVVQGVELLFGEIDGCGEAGEFGVDLLSGDGLQWHGAALVIEPQGVADDKPS